MFTVTHSISNQRGTRLRPTLKAAFSVPKRGELVPRVSTNPVCKALAVSGITALTVTLAD